MVVNKKFFIIMDAATATLVAEDYVWMWVIIAFVVFMFIFCMHMLPSSTDATTPAVPAPAPSKTPHKTSSSSSFKEKVFYGLALAAIRAALFKYCPHLSPTQHNLVVSTLIKWKEREYKQASYICQYIDLRCSVALDSCTPVMVMRAS